MKVFLDDCREAPNGWERLCHALDVISLLDGCSKRNIRIEILSLDNDLGLEEAEGREVLDWLEWAKFVDPDFLFPDRIVVHSANPVARQRMETVIRKLYSK